jgi:hypothetical protein
MSNPMQMWNAWYSLSLQTARLARRAWWPSDACKLPFENAQGRQTEARRMVTEKVAALTEAQVAVATAAIKGGSSQRITRKVLGVYKKRVHRNKRRLMK